MCYPVPLGLVLGGCRNQMDFAFHAHTHAQATRNARSPNIHQERLEQLNAAASTKCQLYTSGPATDDILQLSIPQIKLATVEMSALR